MNARSVLCVLGLTLPLAGQEEGRIAAAIGRLGAEDPELRLLAERELLRLGKRAAQPLARTLSESTDEAHADARRFDHALFLLRRLGPDAESALEELCDLAWNGDEAVQVRAVRALGHLVPHFPDRVSEGLAFPRLEPAPEDEDDERLPRKHGGELAQAYFWVRNRLGASRGIQRGSIETVLHGVHSHDTWVRGFALEELARLGEAGESTVHELASAVVADHPDALGIQEVSFHYLRAPDGRLGRRIVFDNYDEHVDRDLEVQEQAALALLQVAPEGPDALLAWSFLALHGDEVRRIQACRRLARLGNGRPGAADALTSVLEDDSLFVLREAVSGLGMLGTAARTAIPRLEELSGHDDPQLAARAKAALRQIEENG